MLTFVTRSAKSVARRVAPDLYATVAPALLDWWRGERAPTPGRPYPTEELRLLAEKFGLRAGFVVLGGPFRGMKYVTMPGEGNLLPKLLGSYEEELQSLIESWPSRQYDGILNIGCAEGYYAVGLALLISGIRVRAFDIDESARHLCAELAAMNGVAGRLSIGSRCDREVLRKLDGSRTLIVCDCEGCEAELFDATTVAALRRSDVLMELHDFIDPAISKLLVHRFKRSHRTTLITSVVRDPETYPQLSFLSPKERAHAVDEFRPGIMQWAFFEART